MTCTNQQVKLFMNCKNQYPVLTAAAKAGMCPKTARKYLKLGKLPSECKKARTHRTRSDPFAEHWQEIEELLKQAPELQAKTVLYYLMERYPNRYSDIHLRTLQRRVRDYLTLHGASKAVMFLQNIQPGQSSQSDWTEMNSLNITIAREPFSHCLFHFMLPYSCWESIMICHNESFETLTKGFARATLELGGTLPVHRTDNLSAATQKAGGSRAFTERWQQFLDHYDVNPSRNNPGVSHENGSVEKSHDLFKNAVNQHLLLRGSRDFADLADYEAFLTTIKERRNLQRQEKLKEELPYLQALPDRGWRDPITFTARVSPSSTIQVLGCTYSVPSRLISYTLKVQVYPDTVELYYGQKLLITMPRINEGVRIDYRHIIDSLIRKPGAFAQYQYRAQLFPQPIFRIVYDQLIQVKPETGHKSYLKILHLAKCYGESQVVAALHLAQGSQILPDEETISGYLQVAKRPCVETTILAPNLAAYDSLHSFGGCQ